MSSLPSKPEVKHPWPWLLALGVVLAALALALPANHDVGWLLYVGRRIVHGARPYVDFVEINPPPIVGLETAVAGLAGFLKVPALKLHSVLTLLLAVTCAALTTSMASARLEGDRRLLFGVGLLAILVTLPGYETGQREHLAMALLFPYLTALGVDRRVRPAPAVMAGLAVALKPHLLLVAAGAELVQKRASRRHLVPFFGTLVLLGAASLLFAPAYLPAAIRYAPAYAPIEQDFRFLLAIHPFTLTSGAILSASLLLVRHGADRGLVVTYTAAAIGGIGSLLMQAKGFPYHFLPMGSLAVMAGVSAAATVRRSPGRVVIAIAAALAVGLGVFQLGVARQIIRGPLHERPGLESELRPYGPGTTVLGLNWAMESAFPLVTELEMEWESPFHSLWVVRGARAAEADELLKESIDRIAASAASPPDLILLDTAAAGPRPAVEIRPFLSHADPRFGALFARYRIRATVGRFAILEPAPGD